MPQTGISVEKYKIVSATGQIMDYKSYFLFKKLAPCRKFKGFVFLGRDINPRHPAFVKIGEVNLAVFGLGASPFAGARTFIYVIQYSVGARRLIKEKPISSSLATNGNTGKAVSATSNEVIFGKYVLYFFNTDTYHRLKVIFLSSIESLNGTEHHRVFDVSIDYGDTEYLKSMFDSRGASRPEANDMICLFARFGDIT